MKDGGALGITSVGVVIPPYITSSPLYKVESGKRKVEGLGLGLAILGFYWLQVVIHSNNPRSNEEFLFKKIPMGQVPPLLCRYFRFWPRCLSITHSMCISILMMEILGHKGIGCRI